MTLAADGNVAAILSDFGGDPQRAEGLATFLGFEPVSNPEDRLAGPLSGGLKQFLRGRGDGGFGVSELYRVGNCRADPAEAGLWIGVLSDWGYRSSDRDRSRRRITRALVEHVPDRRSLALLVPPSVDPRREAELIFPRTQIGGSNGAVTSVRAHLDLDNPTRFHRDLLRGLRIPPSANLLEVSRTWQQQFSVERVTTKFYQEYAAVRDRIAKALLAHNQDHSVVKSFTQDEARAWATRQMGRVLFLWFLQAKRWLGEPGGQGSITYLLDLWARRSQTDEGEYYRGILSPMFFDAMATGSSSRSEHPVLGFVPYLNGGLFRRSALEDRVNDAGEVSLPDEVFDPESDGSLLNLLSRYRFTTRESTPDDQSVDPDPELLGRVFENLHQGDERRNTGTYYTPREIVHFMCREALDGYLRDETGVDQGTLNALRQEAIGSRDEHKPLPNIPADALIDALEKVRVCDPAVGSGAFLLGAIQEIVALRRGILFTQRSYVEPNRVLSDGERLEAAHHREQPVRSGHQPGGCGDMPPAPLALHGAGHGRAARSQLRLGTAQPGLPDRGGGLAGGPGGGRHLQGIMATASRPAIEAGPAEQSSTAGEQHRPEEKGVRAYAQKSETPPGVLRDLIARDQREIVRLHLGGCAGEGRGKPQGPEQREEAYQDRAEPSAELGRPYKLPAGQCRVNGLRPGAKAILWPIAFPEVLREGDPNAGFDIVLANPPYVRMEKLDNEDQSSPTGRLSRRWPLPGQTSSCTSTPAPCRYSGPAAGCPSSPATSSCGPATGPVSVSTFRLPCASSGSLTSATCLCSRPTARLSRPTRPCWWATAPMTQPGMPWPSPIWLAQSATSSPRPT